MNRLKSGLIITLLLISYLASATNYYVSSSSGSDSNDGKTSATAWKTISKVNSKSLSAGDSVLFKKGDDWRETLTVIASGTSAAYVNYATYGSGSNPRFLGSEKVTSWVNQGANVWKSANTFTDPGSVGDFGSEIFFESASGVASWGVSSSTLASEFNWKITSGYIYVYCTQDPATKYFSVEIPQRANIINLNDKNYIHIKGINLFYCGTSAITYKTYPMILQTGLIIEYSTIAYIATKNSEVGYGIDATYSDMIVRHCDIHDCGRRSISHHLYGNYTATNILIEDNYFHDGWHTTGPDFSVGGSGTTGSIDGVIIRRNKFYDPLTTAGYSEEIFIQNYLYSSLQSQVKNIYIYSNIFLSPSGNSINMEGTQSVYVYNNVFYNHRTAGASGHVWIDNNNSLVQVKNNIFYTISTNDIGGEELFVRSGQDIKKVDANYNLYYRINNNLRIVDIENQGTFYMNTIAALRTQFGLEKNSPTPANPLFVSTSDYHVQSGSPAVGAGLAIPAVVSDYEGNTFANPPNIGCYATPVLSTVLAYASSSIENSDPAKLLINFSQSLASVIPGVSAFTVTVNSVTRAVSSLAISGNQVQLTLSSAVANGDVVTVSYTKPSSNPIQTSSGLQASAFSNQSVLNNVSPIPVYVSSAVQDATPSVLDIIYNIALANIIPSTSAFTVLVNGVSRSVTSLTISGTKVSLILSSPIVNGNVVTLAYTKPSANPLQTDLGGLAATITAKSVTNNVAPPVPVYVSSVIQNASPTILEMTYSSTLVSNVPAASAFTVLVNSITRSVSSVAISGTKILLTLSSAVVYGDIVTVAYTKPATNPIQSTSGGQASSIVAQSVTNSVTPPLPSYQSSTIQNATPSVIQMTFSLSLAATIPATSAFSVSVNSVSRIVSSVSISGTNVLLTLASPVVYGDVVTVSYTKPTTNPLQTDAGAQAASLSGLSVTNNVLAVPAYVSSAVQNAAPSVVAITYSLSLASIVPAASAFNVMVNSVSRSITSVAVSATQVQLTLATPVVFGDVVTVSYTKPSTNPLQTTAGGQAGTLTAQTVTNNVVSSSPFYVSSVVQNATPTVIEMTYSLALAGNIIPAASAFTVMVNSIAVSVSSVAISGSKVLLTISTPVVYGNSVTVAYIQPASNQLQSTAGGLALTISAQTVTNNVASQVPVYVSSVIENAAPSVLVMTYNIDLAAITPARSAFTVMINGTRRTVSSVAVSGSTVSLTLASAVVFGNTVTVAYRKPTTNPLQSATGQQAVTLTAQTVTNNVLSSIPIYVGSVIENAAPSVLVMTYSLSLASVLPAGTAFTVMVNGVRRTVSSVSVSGNSVSLTLSSAIIGGDVVTVAYTRPSTNPLQSVLGGFAASLSALPVTNNVVTVIPVYISSVVENFAPSVLVLTYDLNLAQIIPSAASFTVLVNSAVRTVSSVSVSGTSVSLILASPVVYGDAVTVAYNKPSSNPLQAILGGQAASISGQPVTNNVAAPVPVYVTSVVQDASRSVVELIYSLSLAGIVPSATAFTVTVNSVVRSITSVSVSGTSVMLSLSSPLVYGDIVTVAYTKPASNPLQTSAGAQVASITAQPVTNNIIATALLYVSSVVQNATPSVVEITYSLTLANIIPSATAFSVTVNSIDRPIISVSLSGSKVLLTLTSPVVYGDVITLAYTQPSANLLQSTAGSLAATLAPVPVTNNVASIQPVYQSSVIENAAPSNLVMKYSLNLASAIPDVSAFTVLVNGSDRSVSSVAISGTNVTLLLSSPVVFGDVVTVAYLPPVLNPVQSTLSIQASALSAQPVTNNVLSVIPVYVRSVVQNATPSVIVMTYDRTLAQVLPAASDFTVFVNSTARTVSSVSISGTTVSLSLSSPILFGNVVTVGYAKPLTNPLQSAQGGLAATITSQSVTNNVVSVIPIFTAAVVENAAPSVIVMSYNQNLAQVIPAVSAFSVLVNSTVRTVSAITISGGNVSIILSSPVVYGEAVTISYTQPSVSQLQSTSGGLAASLVSQPVTNNVASLVPVYVSSVIENASPSLLVMTYNSSLASVLPSASSFTVIVNLIRRTVTSVSVSGTNVLLTLSSPVVYGDGVTIAYTKSSVNPLQTPQGGVAATLATQPVTNNVNIVVPVYVSSVIENASPSVIAVTYNTTLASISPAPSSFTVMVNSVQRTVTSVAITGFRVLLTLSSAVVNGDIITLSYSVPAFNALQTSTGGTASAFVSLPVINNVSPTTPSYLSSVVENDTPSLITIAYNLTLAAIIPDVSAFTVKINSVQVDVTSVAIVNGKVLLTIAGTVLYGDLVTVSYTKPSVNPLQSATGSEASGSSSQVVRNNVGTPNYTPVVVINYETTVYSGFISGIDASDSYDLNGDNLTFQWTAPDQIPVSSTVDSKIRFLAPMVTEPTTVQFKLDVSDGKITQRKTMFIKLLPYLPELGTAKVQSLESDDFTGTDYPTNVFDGNPLTSWSSQGDGHWIVESLFDQCYISYILLSYPASPLRSFYFDIYASHDDVTWDPVLINAASCSFSGNQQVFEFPAAAKSEQYSFVKLLCHENSTDDMNFVSEFKIFGNSLLPVVNESIRMNIFPNPANDYVRILLSESPSSPFVVRLVDLKGKIVLENSIQSLDNYISLPLSFRSGLYLVELISGNQIMSVGRLIVHELRGR